MARLICCSPRGFRIIFFKRATKLKMDTMNREQFLREARAYVGKLGQASSMNDIVKMWRSTNLPYHISSSDPHSLQYKEEILSLYQDLAQVEYDVKNEWTSTKQTPEMFEIGYPWVSKNFAIIAEETAKPIQVLRALQEIGLSNPSVIEFGAGWGNLSIPLAKSGARVTMVDIDKGFLDRALRIAEREGLVIDHRCGDFLEVALAEEKRFDVVVFQSSFHHCLEFEKLLTTIKSNVLNDKGLILFVSEPITSELQFPWGLRYDGESLWAIMCNQWLELGFHRDFFIEMLMRRGFLPTRLDEIHGLVGEGWRAVRGEEGVAFRDLILPTSMDSTFHSPDHGMSGRFCQARSILPQLRGENLDGYDLTFVNYGRKTLHFSVQGSKRKDRLSLGPDERRTLQFPAVESEVLIESEVFVPHQQIKNSDIRVLGVNLDRIKLVFSD